MALELRVRYCLSNVLQLRESNIIQRPKGSNTKFKRSALVVLQRQWLQPMKSIGLLSDTHGWLDEKLATHFSACDEIWHAGDFGPADVVAQLRSWGKPLRGVWGNIDGGPVRYDFPETAVFMVEGVKVAMKHIGGYPGRYAPGVKAWLQAEKPRLFISGHSHILKAQYDPVLQCLHLNPGAAGRHGWHQVRTAMRFVIDGENIRDLEVIELGKRSALGS